MNSAPAGKRYVKRLLLWVMFVVSTCFLGLLMLLIVFLATDDRVGNSGNSSTAWGTLVAAVASFLTSVSSLIGLILGWKKHKTETQKANLEVKRLELELERAALEMDKSRKQKRK